MSQSKLTYQEIIDKLQKANITIDEFAYNCEDEVKAIPEDFKISEESKILVDKKEEIFKQIENHPDRQTNPRTKEIQDLWDEWEKYSYEYEALVKEYLISSSIPEWKEVHQQGGEGEGDHWESVKYFPDHDVYIKVTGYYQSYNGTEFYGGYKDCCSEVRPEEKTITVYG